MVCNINSEQTKKIMTDIVHTLIETARKTSKEARVNIGTGHLHLFKNGELVFDPKDDALAVNDNDSVY